MLRKWIGVQIDDSFPRSTWSYTATFRVAKGSYVIRKLRMVEHRSACSVRKTFRRSTTFFTNVINTLCGTSLINYNSMHERSSIMHATVTWDTINKIMSLHACSSGVVHADTSVGRHCKRARATSHAYMYILVGPSHFFFGILQMAN